MAIRDLAGTGALQDSLATTNSHLVAVLEELQQTNRHLLEDVAAGLRTLNLTLEELLRRQG